MFIFAGAIWLGMALSGVAAWGDFEANRFDAGLSLLRDKSLTTFRCPILLASGESGTVSATFSNPLDRPVVLSIVAHISRYLTLRREEAQRLSLAPDETQRLAWTVAPEDVVYDHLILVKVIQHRRYPLPSRLGSCGIVVVNLPYLTGNQLLALGLAASGLGIVAGLRLWFVANRPLTRARQQTLRTLYALAGCTLGGLVASLAGGWMIGVILLAADILLIGAIIGHSMSST